MIRKLFCTKQIPEDRHVKGKERKKKYHISDRVFNHSTRCRNLGSSRYALQHDSPPPPLGYPALYDSLLPSKKSRYVTRSQEIRQNPKPKTTRWRAGFESRETCEADHFHMHDSNKRPQAKSTNTPPQLHRPSLTQCK